MRRDAAAGMADAMECSARVGLRIHSSPQELIETNWVVSRVSEVPPASIQVEVARLHATTQRGET